MYQCNKLSIFFPTLCLVFSWLLSLSEGIPVILKDASTPKYWHQNRCRLYLGVDSFHVPDYGYVDCSLNSCPLTKETKYNVTHCFICCWGKITG